jgi:hypothetical protein
MRGYVLSSHEKPLRSERGPRTFSNALERLRVQALPLVWPNKATGGLPSEPRLERWPSGALQDMSERGGQDLSPTEEDSREERGEVNALKAWFGGKRNYVV